MGQRLSRIYTRTGDDGSTGMANGDRITKDSARIEVIGCVDELNSAIGVLRAHEMPEAINKLLAEIQHRLFDLGGELSLPGSNMIQEDKVQQLEQSLDHYNSALPTLREFILPAGAMAGAHCHLARAIARRTERRLCTLHNLEAVNPHSLAYLNRLSDLLFVIARSLIHLEQGEEVYWEPQDPS